MFMSIIGYTELISLFLAELYIERHEDNNEDTKVRI